VRWTSERSPPYRETLDWAQALVALQVEDLSPEVLRQTLNVICKQPLGCFQQVSEKIAKLLN